MKSTSGRLVLLLLALLWPSVATARPLAYVEEFYRLYYLPMIYQTGDLNRDLVWLQWAQKAPFAPPIQALVVQKTPESYARYQKLLRLHIDYLMAQTCMALGAEFDKHEPVFFNKPYSNDILASLEYARYHYQSAGNYWDRFLERKKELDASKKIRVELEFTEDLLLRVDSGDLDLRRVIKRQLAKIENTKRFFKEP